MIYGLQGMKSDSTEATALLRELKLIEKIMKHEVPLKEDDNVSNGL
jgi:hypothetical protein